MKIFNASDVKDKEVQRRIASLHLFREIRQHDQQQYQLLLEKSRVHFFEPGETVLSPGGLDGWLYFVVRGELDVVASDGEQLLSQLASGEIFGDISQLTQKPRGVYVRVPQEGRKVTIFAVDFDYLGDLDYHQEIFLTTKIYVYRQLVHILRWRNDCYRQKFPDNETANKPYGEKFFSGRGDSIEELHSLARQAHSLAERLVFLNRELGALNLPELES